MRQVLGEPVPNLNVARSIAIAVTPHAWIVVACAVVALLVMFPVTDPDTYWHLANGRAMVEQGRIVNEEIFSYTRAGATFSNHEWLAQIILYRAYQFGGWWGVVGLRLVLALCVTALVYATCRRLGVAPFMACVAVIVTVLCGLHRFSPRPELFSLVAVAGLGYFIHSFQQQSMSTHATWLLPPLMLVWDWLHGAIFGFVILIVLAVGENAKRALQGKWPALAVLPPERLRALNIALVVTLVLMLLNPYGLLSYDIFIEFLRGNPLVDVIAEFSFPTWQTYQPFWIFLIITTVAMFANWRHTDLTWWLLLIPFTYLAARYLRMIEIYCILAAPIAAALITRSMQSIVFDEIIMARVRKAAAVIVMVVLVIYIGWIKFANDSVFGHFGTGPDTTYYPEGVVRMIDDIGLTGRMYNTGHLGGYLAFYLAPQRKIFQYNHHTVFGNTWRWVQNPGSLDAYNVDYAIISEEPELRLFPAEQWGIIYKDKKVFLLLRRTPEHAALIERYEVRYFLANRAALDNLASDLRVYPRLMLETSTYLTYRHDAKVASAFADLINLPAHSLLGASRELLVRAACRANSDVKALSCANGS